jgi:nucleoid DNA-binding protein
MTKNDIVMAIVKNDRDVNGNKFKREDVQSIINYFVELSKSALRGKDKVVIRGFGTFVVRHTKPKRFKHVRTGEEGMSSEKDHVAFVQSNDFELDV